MIPEIRGRYRVSGVWYPPFFVGGGGVEGPDLRMGSGSMFFLLFAPGKGRLFQTTCKGTHFAGLSPGIQFLGGPVP